jgi:hypothetical protein
MGLTGGAVFAGGIATTVGNDFHWEGTEPLPEFPEGISTAYGFHANFDATFDTAQVYLSSGITGAGLTWEMAWAGMDVPQYKGYSDGGIEANLILIGTEGTDFTTTNLTDENFSSLVEAMRLEYYPPEENPDNFVAALVGEGPLQEFVPSPVPEPTSLVMLSAGLVGLLYFVRRKR